MREGQSRAGRRTAMRIFGGRELLPRRGRSYVEIRGVEHVRITRADTVAYFCRRRSFAFEGGLGGLYYRTHLFEWTCVCFGPVFGHGFGDGGVHFGIAGAGGNTFR